MKTHILLLFLVLWIGLESCQVHKTIPADNKISIGIIDSIPSKILNETRKIWIYVPEKDNLYSPLTYPVVYLLDGDVHFYSVMGILHQLSMVNMNQVFPKMILVGIPNTNRTYDLTPPDSAGPNRESGGSEKFTEFLEKELFPYIDQQYPVTPYRILIGHSLGGLFAMNTMINHTRLFNSYLAIDPSMDWNDNKSLIQAEKLLKTNDFKGISLYLSIANQGYSDTDSTKDNKAAFRLAQYLDNNSNHHLRYQWHYYQDDNHASIPLISEYDGLRYLFDFYNPRLPYTQFRQADFDVLAYLQHHYQKVSENMGYFVPPPEELLNWLGYLFIMEKQYNKSADLFKLNVKNFPGSFNAYDSYAEALLMTGDTLGALENYKASYQLNPHNENARKMIDHLKKLLNK